MRTLIYVHDPMCSWCYGFSASLSGLMRDLPGDVRVRRLLGGLAPDSDQPMADDVRRYIQSQWHRIQEQVPGTVFNFDFWTECAPRRSTYPACRAVIAARIQEEDKDLQMTRAIQRAYYLEARNPSDEATLAELAAEIGLDRAAFERDLQSAMVQDALLKEIAEVRALRVPGFPSLLIGSRGQWHRVDVDYHDHRRMLKAVEATAAGVSD